MKYISKYKSPLGNILMSGNENGLSGLWIDGQKHFAHRLGDETEECELPVFKQTKKWLDIYFSGLNPDFMPKFDMTGTAFQTEVWKLLLEIPYGRTATYGGIAKKIASRRGIGKMSAQAVGGAVGRNPISIIVPCHRVVGTNGSLTGYDGGIDKKEKLLLLEKADLSNVFDDFN